MRIKQNKLTIPDYQWSRMINNKLGIIQLYHKPCYCVNIIYGDSKQCYPITKEQYDNYRDEYIMRTNPNYRITMFKKFDKLAQTTSDPHLKTFYENVRSCYA